MNTRWSWHAAAARPRLAAWAARDLRWAIAVHRAVARRWLQRTLALVSRLGDGWLWTAVLAALPFVLGDSGLQCARRMLVVGAINLVLYLAIKRTTGRHRPYVRCADIRIGTPALDQFSFPSGHTLHAVAFWLVILQDFPLLAMALAPFVALVALSRVALGLHYPSDVLAGVLLGSATAAVVIAVF